MKSITARSRILVGLSLLACTWVANAAWTLDNDASHLSFISIKKDAIAEVHKFSHLSGSINSDGAVKVTIELASVDTAIAIRDERIRELLFQTELFPKASVTAKVDPTKFNQLMPGLYQTDSIQLTLSLHGQSKTIDAQVGVVRLQGGKLLVSTIQPIIIDAADFGLEKGIDALMKIAKLNAISSAVPVTLIFVFDETN
jgi:polyisoprenoid-binding protein YceI